MWAAYDNKVNRGSSISNSSSLRFSLRISRVFKHEFFLLFTLTDSFVFLPNHLFFSFQDISQVLFPILFFISIFNPLVFCKPLFFCSFVFLFSCYAFLLFSCSFVFFFSIFDFFYFFSSCLLYWFFLPSKKILR